MFRTRNLIPLLLGTAMLVGACDRQNPQPAAPPERVVNVATVVATRVDLPVTEVAVGAETGLADAVAGGQRSLVRLPFPIDVARRLTIGQSVELRNFGEDGVGRGRVRSIRPALNVTTASAEVIVEPDPGWQPRGSVRGEVLLETRRQAVVIPETALVLRPAGSVVYVAQAGVARERPVVTGVNHNGLVEILEGLAGGENVVTDGAAMLSDGARLREPEAKS